MNERELLDNKILCLRQLRLSKWQLVWNREFDLDSIENIKKPSINKSKIEGNMPEGMVENAEKNLKQQMVNAIGEMTVAKLEIQLLDQRIKILEEEQAKVPVVEVNI